MAKQHNWVVQLCDYHAAKFTASYFAFSVIKDALQAKGSCHACKMDMPHNIVKVDIVVDEDQE
jgi:predicted short-subunit dehydrogenase-like oxidoreductase (DUF2520 family)